MGDLLNTLHVPSGGVREALGMHLGRPGPWAGLGKGHKCKNKPCSTPHADSGFAVIPPMWPAAVSKKEVFSGPEHPVTGGPVGAEIAMRW